MKTSLVPVLSILLTVSLCLAEDLPKFPKLKLKSGREYENVTVTQKRPDGISIAHESGTARVKFEDLPDDVVKQCGGFDPAAAAKSRQEADAKEAATLAEIDRGVAAQGEAKQAVADHRETVAGSSPGVLKVIQATESGLLCRIAWFKDQRQGTTSKDSFGRNIVTYKTVPALTNLSEDFHFVTGITGAVDGAELGVALVEDGTYQYTKVTGAASTVKKWKAINGAVNAAGSTNKPTYSPPKPPASWKKSVGGG